jgi:hypothetical protein
MAAAVATARLGLGERRGKAAEYRREGGSRRLRGGRLTPPRRHLAPPRRHLAPPRLGLARRQPRARVCASGTGTGASRLGTGTGTGDSDPDLRRCGSLLGQNEKGEIRNRPISIPGQAEPNSYSGAGQESKRATSIRRIEFRSGPNRRNRTSPNNLYMYKV